jgi:protein-S-isoprenylcysteine O-methyltransferase Ste14
MALIQSMEKQGNFLFKYRGQFPVILFFLAVPFIYSTDYNSISQQFQNYCLSFASILSAIGYLVRFYTIGTTPRGTSGRNTKQQVANVLNSTGMYSVLRHPLYFGNYLIWLGIAVATLNIFFIVIMSLLFWLYYERIIFAEERFLERKFGDDYLDWSNTLPAFIPSILHFRRSDTPFSIITVLRREYASVLSGVIGFTFVELFTTYFSTDSWGISTFSLQFLIFTLFLVFILKLLKSYTNLLNEEGRS